MWSKVILASESMRWNGDETPKRVAPVKLIERTTQTQLLYLNPKIFVPVFANGALFESLYDPVRQ